MITHLPVRLRDAASFGRMSIHRDDIVTVGGELEPETLVHACRVGPAFTLLTDPDLHEGVTRW